MGVAVEGGAPMIWRNEVAEVIACAVSTGTKAGVIDRYEIKKQDQ